MQVQISLRDLILATICPSKTCPTNYTLYIDKHILDIDKKGIQQVGIPQELR